MALGFSLTELLTAIAIVGILASIAIPSYRQYVLRSHLPEAMDALNGFQIQMEHYYQDAGSYSCAALTMPANTKYFNFSCANATAQTFTATATGVGMTAGYVYTVDDSATPRKTLSFANVTLTGKTCWIMKPGDC